MKIKKQIIAAVTKTLLVIFTLALLACPNVSDAPIDKLVTPQWTFIPQGTESEQTGFPAAPDGDIYGIAYGNGRFVAVGMQKNKGNIKNEVVDIYGVINWDGIMSYSNNAVNWQALHPESFKANVYQDWFAVRAIAYANGKFIAGGPNGKMLSSGNGIDWTPIAAPLYFDDYGDIRGITWGGDRFIAVKSAYTAWSTNGVDWNSVAAPVSLSNQEFLECIAYGNGTFVVGSKGKIVYSTDNGANWQATQLRAKDWTISKIAFGGGKFVAAGNEGMMAYSTDGIVWALVLAGKGAEKTQFYDSDTISDVIYAASEGGGQFIALGGDGIIVYSTNGADWTRINDDSLKGTGMGHIIYADGRYVVGGSGGIAYTARIK